MSTDTLVSPAAVEPMRPSSPPLWILEHHVATTVADQACLDLHRIRPDSRLLEELHMDSLELVELVLRLEEQFDVCIPDDITQKMFVRQPLTIRTLAEIVLHQWGTGRPLRRRWRRQPEEQVDVAARPFTQLGGVASTGELRDGPLHVELAITETGARQWRRRTDGMRCVLIPAAEVEIGCEQPGAAADEQPAHRARLDAFLMDAEPVSVAAFARFLNSADALESGQAVRWFGVVPDDRRSGHVQIRIVDGRWEPVPGAARQPVVLVSWHGAAAYSRWAHRQSWHDAEDAGRLPSEAQWEYAARGAVSQRFPWGEGEASPARALTDLHRARQNYPNLLPLADVNGHLGMSPFGLHHMAGNVWNWCADWYAPDFYRYPEALFPNPLQRLPTGIRSERGGSWVGPACLARSSFRRGRPPGSVGRCLGFRCALPFGEVATPLHFSIQP